MISTLLLLAVLPLTVASKGDLDVRGAAVNPGEFQYSRRIPAVPRGLVRLSLDADVLAHRTKRVATDALLFSRRRRGAARIPSTRLLR